MEQLRANGIVGELFEDFGFGALLLSTLWLKGSLELSQGTLQRVAEIEEYSALITALLIFVCGVAGRLQFVLGSSIYMLIGQLSNSLPNHEKTYLELQRVSSRDLDEFDRSRRNIDFGRRAVGYTVIALLISFLSPNLVERDWSLTISLAGFFFVSLSYVAMKELELLRLALFREKMQQRASEAKES